MQLASRFGRGSPVLRADRPLTDDQIRSVVPSIFAEAPHESRSERYSYIPTAAILTELRKEGFEPFMVCQTRVRQEDRRDFTKHMIRLRHASQINGAEANEVILLNSHDGTSSYQMLGDCSDSFATMGSSAATPSPTCASPIKATLRSR
ncbi:YafZ-like protein [Pseudomonas chlororaphis subsp. aureofaciens]|nr:YafZ-like protein [Pseudomonas chlororaphis subsp. aureofaciens]